MTGSRTWQDKTAIVGIVLFVAGVCLLAAKSLCFRALYGRHDNVLIVCSEVGLIASIAAFIFVLFDKRTARRVILAIASLVLSYLFFSGVAWWMMVK
jgi:drug/metabolite transporter (DMT)-like permease